MFIGVSGDHNTVFEKRSMDKIDEVFVTQVFIVEKPEPIPGTENSSFSDLPLPKK